VDVAVVGRGGTGLSCARVLAESGLRVRVLEARRAATGASGRNEGFALRGLSVPYARKRLRDVWRFMEEAVEHMAEVAGDAFRRAGSLYVVASEEEAAAARVEQAALVEDGTHRWAGSMGFTPDWLPLVGELPGREGVWVSLGYSGHGNVLALACGEGVARALLGRADPRLEPLSPERILGARAPA
jgi:glycine/D-amino acid oxidase-like deaminating enzyme